MVTIQAPPRTCSSGSSIVQEQIERFYENLPAGEVASGVSVGVIQGVDDSGAPVITQCYSGFANVPDGTPITEDTVFEIGSVSKTFTTTMPAEDGSPVDNLGKAILQALTAPRHFLK